MHLTDAVCYEIVEAGIAVVTIARPAQRNVINRGVGEGLRRAGWLGIAIPEAYGGSGLGVTEASVMMQAVGRVGRLP